MTDPGPQFDDPSLKAALRELRGGHRAAAELRAKVAHRLGELHDREGAAVGAAVPKLAAHVHSGKHAGTQVQTDMRQNRASVFRIWRPLAAAAAVLVAIGGTTAYFYYRHDQEVQQEYARNDALLDAMIAAHDAASVTAAGEVALSASLTDPSALAAEASKQLSRTVPVADFASLGWKLDAAAFCKINNCSSVRMHFVRDNRAVTVVSLPSSAWDDGGDGGRDGDHYELVSDGHPIAGYIHGGSLTCVVGDTSTSPDEATRLRDLLRHG